MIEVTVSELRDGLADLLGKVQHGGELVEITKHGKSVAYVVSAAEWAFLQDCEDLYWGPRAERAYQEHLANPGAARTIDEILAEQTKKYRRRMTRYVVIDRVGEPSDAAAAGCTHRTVCLG